MQWLAALCVKRPVFATVLILSLTVIGAFSFTRLGVDRFPKVDIPTITVTTVQPGAAPEQVETEITDKIEEAVNTISGIDDLRSISSEGISQVIITFLLDKDTDVAAQEVRDKINGALPRLPKTIQQPRVDKMDPDAAPVLSLALSAKNQPVRDITEYADKVLRRQNRKRQRRRSGADPRRPAAPDQRLARRRSPPRLQPHRHRCLARPAGAEHRDPGRAHGPGTDLGQPAHPRPRPDRRRVQRHRHPREERPPGQDRRRRAGRGRRGRCRHAWPTSTAPAPC